jgi:hypothetical protein
MSSEFPKILLQYLHSALIDELSERLPKEPLVLGLPKREQKWFLPSCNEVAASSSVSCEVTGPGGQKYLACLAFDEALWSKLKGVSREKFWESVRGRAAKEFKQRSIECAFSVDIPVENLSKDVKLVVWLTIKVGPGICCPGVAFR